MPSFAVATYPSNWADVRVRRDLTWGVDRVRPPLSDLRHQIETPGRYAAEP